MTFPDTYHLTGLTPIAAPTNDAARPSMAKHVPNVGHHPGWLDPENPLLWFGVLLAATLGLVGVAGAVRVGPARARVAVGDT